MNDTRPSPALWRAAEQEQVQKVTVPRSTSTASKVVQNSLVHHVSRQSVSSSVEENVFSHRSSYEYQERMPFELNPGEEEEASSFVPLPNARNREGGPIRWSLRYLRESAGEEGGMVIGGGGFGETKHKTGRS